MKPKKTQVSESSVITRPTPAQPRWKTNSSPRSTPGKSAPAATTTPATHLFAGERQKGESNAAVQACNDYLLLGAGRSLPRLAHIYQTWDSTVQTAPDRTKPHQTAPETADAEGGCDDDYRIPTVDKIYPRPVNHYRLQQKNADAPLLYSHRIQAAPPTLSLDALKRWSTAYGWMVRGSEFDAQLSASQLAQHKRIMGEGMALAYNRLSFLSKMFEYLMVELFTEDSGGNMINLWVRDIKQIGHGEDATNVTLIRYNSALVNDVRNLLDDIAKECGGRKHGLESFVRDLPWLRLPEKYGKRLITENPKEVLYSMIEEVCDKYAADELAAEAATGLAVASDGNQY